MAALVELRILDGPNLYFGRAAIKLTLDLSALMSASDAAARSFAARIGLRNARPGSPHSGFRQRFAARAVARLVRQVAAEAGTHRLAVRVRPLADHDQVVVAYPWRHRDRAVALGEAVARVVDAVPSADVDDAISAAAADVRRAGLGAVPPTIRPRIPVVAVTGTNGKTTTSRLIGHIGRTAGMTVGWSSTDGIYLDGELIEAGDYSGPSGAGRVLAQPNVELAVTETARGGILLRGVGVAWNDVAVVTNVSADHLGLQGVDTVDQLAEVKAVVPRMTRKGGWAVLNGDDPRVFAMRTGIVATPWVFSRHPGSPAIREVLTTGGRATSVIDGWICVFTPARDPMPLLELVDVPMTLAGLSRFNVENALAATSAALALGIGKDTVVQGLRTFAPGPELNPGRMNVYSLDDTSVIIDLAHNEAGLEALLEIGNGLRRAGARLLLAMGTAGDRTDDILAVLSEIGARNSDVMVIVHKLRYMRGRTRGELDEIYRSAAAHVGITDVPSFESELAGLQALVEQAHPGDVVAIMCHQDRELLHDWLIEQGATVDDPAALRAKVRRAHPGVTLSMD